MKDEALHTIARSVAEGLADADRKQLRFNEIVQVAKAFYVDAAEGVHELVNACDRVSLPYVNKRPMWQTLRDDYAWMTA